MRLLAFDTSTDTLSIAVQHGRQVLTCEQDGGPQASRMLLSEIQRLLAEAELTLRQLDAIVYGCGPGAFTGLRVASSVAQGLAFGSGVQVLGIDSLSTQASAARIQSPLQQVVAVLDARMHEIYAAPMHWQADAAGGGWQREQPIRAMAPAQLQVPDGYALVGNAFGVYPELARSWEQRGHTVVATQPQARAMLELAPALIARHGLRSAGHALPLYVRDKVAQTTEERALARQAAAQAGA